MKNLPRIFIGCSHEAYRKGLASALLENLQEWADPEIWTQDFFGYSDTTIEALEEKFQNFDATVFIFQDDDFLKIRDVEIQGVRDNVLFEFGLSIGILGRKKTFFLLPTEPKIRIPTDLNGMTAGMYNPKSSNLRSAMHTCSYNIQKKLSELPNATLNLTKKPQISLDYIKHPNGIDSSSILEQHITKVFSEGLIRKSWNIDLTYDLSNINEGMLIERIIWHYELINITNQDINKEIALSYFADDRNALIKYTIENSKLGKVSLIDNNDVSKDGLFESVKKNITLCAGQTYFVYMQFLNRHSVSGKEQRMHNCFAPREATLLTTIKSHIPKGYVMDVLGAKRIQPDNFETSYDFIIREPLLPEQVIEYIFEKEI